MNPAIVSAVIAALAAIGAGVMSLRTASKANATNDRKVDLEDHRDALDRLKKIIDDQDKHFERVRSQLDRVQDQLTKEMDVSSTLRSQIYKLQTQVDELLRSRARLEEMLTATRMPGTQTG